MSEKSDATAPEASMRAALKQLTPGADANAVSTFIDAHTKYKEYIIKARTANHPKLMTYGSLIVSCAGVLIALAVFFNGSLSHKDEGDMILKILQASDPEHGADNLKAFRRAEAITLSEPTIDALASAWHGKR